MSQDWNLAEAHYMNHFLDEIERGAHGAYGAAGAHSESYGNFLDTISGAVTGVVSAAKKPEYKKRAIISKGSTGADVQKAQELLGLGTTGTFDFQMENAVKAYQLSRSIPSTGVVDEQTWAFLFGEPYTAGSKQDAAGAIATGGAILTGLLSSILPGSNAPAALPAAPAHTTAPTPWTTYALYGGLGLAGVACVYAIYTVVTDAGDT